MRECVDSTIKVERRRTRGGEREAAGSRAMREGICLTYAVSNYNGYNGIICLRIVAAKHCCTVKCSTTNVHHGHRYISLSVPFSYIWSCGFKCIVQSLDSACRYTYTYMHIHQYICELCAMCAEKYCIFRSYAEPITKLHTEWQMKWTRCKIVRFTRR